MTQISIIIFMRLPDANGYYESVLLLFPSSLNSDEDRDIAIKCLQKKRSSKISSSKFEFHVVGVRNKFVLYENKKKIQKSHIPA